MNIVDEVRAAFAEEAADLLRQLERTLSRIESADERPDETLWLEAMRVLHTLKGAAAAASEMEVRSEAHALEDLVRALHAIGEAPGRELVDRIFASLRQIDEALSRSSSPESRERAFNRKTDPPEIRRESLRIRREHIEALDALVGDLTIGRLRQEALLAQMTALRDHVQNLAADFRKLDEEVSDHIGNKPIADSLVAKRGSFSHSMRALTRQVSAMAREATSLDTQLASVETNLGEAISTLRLSPLEPFFEDFANLARETARETGKRIALEIRAEGAEVDRSVLMQLRDPILHLVRNAVVHGIEAPNERMRVGKKEAGTLLLEARCEGSRAILRIADDGAGIDSQRVLSRAIQLGLVEPSTEVGPAGLLDLLSMPGFSTRETVCTLAGRGIGLDAVTSRVEELGGRLSLDTLPGAGSSFSLEVPIRASTSVGLIIEAGDHSFGVLLGHVDRVLRIDPRDDVHLIGNREVIHIDSEPVGLASLAALLDIPEARGRDGEKREVVILRQGRRKMALTVDAIVDEQVLVIKAFGRPFRDATIFVGGAVQPDGDIVPVLHVPELLERASTMDTSSSLLAKVALDERPKRPSILAIDDSKTMRTLLQSLLHSAGYDIHMAEDGEAGLEQLSRMPKCDLVITDLEMPRLDGISLSKAIRNSKTHRHIPILVVTSIGDDEEKRRALSAGADAYIVKAKFERNHFLSIVQGLLGEERAA